MTEDPKSRKLVQHFTPEYLEHGKTVSPQQVVEFLDGYRRLHEPASKSKLISLRVDEALLDTFRKRCEIEGVRYQSKIKELMAGWLGAPD